MSQEYIQDDPVHDFHFFVNHVSTKGHILADSQDGQIIQENPETTERQIINPYSEQKPKRGQSQIPMFEQFANLDTIESILEFTDIYGLLLKEQSNITEEDIEQENYEKLRNQLFSDKLARYLVEISEFKPVFYVWKAYNLTLQKDYKKKQQGIALLNSYFAPQGNDIVTTFPDGWNNSFTFINVTKNYNVQDFALRYIIFYINQSLSENNISLKLVLEKGKVRQRINPENLLGAIWLQLYLAIDGQKSYRECKICHKLIDVTECNEKKESHTQCKNRYASKKRYIPRRIRAGV